MTVKCHACGAGNDVPEAAVVSDAGKIFAARRKRCGPKPRPVPCPWCGRECAGKNGLMAHLPTCPEAIAYYAGLDLSEVSEFFAEAGVPPPADGA
jgi:hypothetical protein